MDARTPVRSPLLWLLAFGCVLAAVSGCSATDSPEQASRSTERAELQGDSVLIDYFREAERERGVPAELLATISYAQTRLTPPERRSHEEDEHTPPEVGVMAIGTGALTSLQVAATLSGIPEQQVSADARANVLAAAAVLDVAAYARGQGQGPGLEQWRDAVIAYGGPALLEEVEILLERGWVGTDLRGGRVAVVGLGRSSGSTSMALGYSGANWDPAHSSNYKSASRSGADIQYIVIHTTQGSYAGAISWFKNASSKVSAHYVIRSSDGQVTQMVDDSDIAHHDGCFNTNSIGIEHEGYVADPGKWYTDAMYSASAELTRWLCDQYGIPKTRQRIMGHGETPDCSSHTDPGSGWDWTKYMQLVTGGGPADPKAQSGSGSGSCAGACGSTQAPAGGSCYCDSTCESYGDCCSDYASACSGGSSPGDGGAATGGASCQGNCGGSSTDGSCYCDEGCQSYGDCCGDHASVCGGTGSASSGSSSCAGLCNSSQAAPAGCYCDATCVTYGDCCSDYTSACGGSGSGSGTSSSSCAGKCESSAATAGGCYCDSACASNGDCCADYPSVCGGGYW